MAYRESHHGRCRWRQSEDEVEVILPATVDTKSKDISFKITSRHLTVGLSEQEHLNKAELCHPVIAGESFWQLDPDASGKAKLIVVSLKKARPGVTWRALLLADDPKPAAPEEDDPADTAGWTKPQVKKSREDKKPEKRGTFWSSVEPGTLAAVVMLLVSLLVGMGKTYYRTLQRV